MFLLFSDHNVVGSQFKNAAISSIEQWIVANFVTRSKPSSFRIIACLPPVFLYSKYGLSFSRYRFPLGFDGMLNLLLCCFHTFGD